MNAATVADLLRQRIGLDPASLGANVLPKLIATRMRALKLTDPQRYAEYLADSAEEFAAILEEVVVAETWFFRGGKVFSFLVERIRRAESSPFRILSVPCSTGEEPYSLALALLESGVPVENWTLEAVDLSERSLTKARRGCYRESAFREMPAALRRKYFHDCGDECELDASARKLVRFRQGNLLDAKLLEGEGRFDLIFCRNVIIYLHEEARKRVIDNLDRLLSADGLLCMGHAEPMSLLDERFQTMGPHECFLFERKQQKLPRRRLEASSSPPSIDAAPRRRTPTRRRSAPPGQAIPIASVDLLAQARKEADAGSLDDALRNCRTHLAVAEPSAEVYCLLGVIHQARKEKTEASACFRKALYLDPQHEEALTHLLLLAQEDGDEAAALRLRQRLQRQAAGGET
jgi:chemotaxis protein methyltransferase WspC